MSDDNHRPLTLQERCDKVHEDWKFKRKDEAIVGILNCLAMLSQAVHMLAKSQEALRQEQEKKK